MVRNANEAAPESRLAEVLSRVGGLHPDVEIGSYPKWREPRYRTKVTFDAHEPSRVAAAREAFVALLPEGTLAEVVDGS